MGGRDGEKRRKKDKDREGGREGAEKAQIERGRMNYIYVLWLLHLHAKKEELKCPPPLCPDECSL